MYQRLWTIGRTSVRRFGAAVGVLGSMMAVTAQAGTIRHDRDDQLYRDYAAQQQFAPVGKYSTSAANSTRGTITLISPEWALTAAHVVDVDFDGSVSDESFANDTVRFGSVTRTVSELIVPAGVNGNPGWNGDINRGFDIALVRLSSPVTEIAPAKLYAGFNELSQRLTSVGFGASGTGLTGHRLSAGTKRAGDNIVDRFVPFANGATAFSTDFDEPAPRVSPNYSGSALPLDLEYQIAPGDSGGGSFLFEDGEWLLAGVHSAIYDTYMYPGTGADGATYGDANLITRVSAYRHFITTNVPALAGSFAVPEPAHAAAVGLVAVLLRRRRA